MFPVDAKILIVDDSSFARKAVKTSLTQLKYWKILEAIDVPAAKALFLEPEQLKERVHLMISDIHMPDLTGLDLVRWVREREETKMLPVIVLTSSQDKADVLAAGKIGVSQYLVKPFETVALAEKIKSTWERHGKKYYEETQKK
jgi:two-component system, chemotaxis family, chemotaxis protein CheY